MNKLLKVIFGIVFTFLFAFTGIGYASLTQEMGVKGFMGLSELKAIYIVSAKQVDASDGSSISDISFTNTLLTGKYTLAPGDVNAFVTVEIMIKNNSDMEAGFNDFISNSADIKYTSAAYSYSNPTGISHMDLKLSPGEFRTFRVTIKYNDNISSGVLSYISVVNFDFISWSITGANAAFEDLLNENFEKLDNAMNDTPGFLWWGRTDDSFISNVGGAASQDQTFVNEVFTGNNTVYVPNDKGELVPKKMNIFIKRANLDGNSATGDANGDEYVLFMTEDQLDDTTIDAEVFACVYTRFSQDQDYVMVGEMFSGKAPVVDYAGTNDDGTGSFTTDRWYSTKSYFGVIEGTPNTYDSQENCGQLGDLVKAAITAGAYEGAPTN